MEAGVAVLQQVAELVAIDMAVAELLPEWGFLEHRRYQVSHTVLWDGQCQSQRKCRGQIHLLDYSRFTHGLWNTAYADKET